jgi:hypothetical protein
MAVSKFTSATSASRSNESPSPADLGHSASLRQRALFKETSTYEDANLRTFLFVLLRSGWRYLYIARLRRRQNSLVERGEKHYFLVTAKWTKTIVKTEPHFFLCDVFHPTQNPQRAILETPQESQDLQARQLHRLDEARGYRLVPRKVQRRCEIGCTEIRDSHYTGTQRCSMHSTFGRTKVLDLMKDASYVAVSETFFCKESRNSEIEKKEREEHRYFSREHEFLHKF